MDTEPVPDMDEKLRQLSIFHYVWAALGIVGLAFLALHYLFMSTMFDPAALAKSAKPPPPEMMRFFANFVWFYVAFAVYGVTTMVLNVLAARWIRARRHWTFCMVVAGINCLSMPLGTILGAFTLILLTKDPVRQSFR